MGLVLYCGGFGCKRKGRKQIYEQEICREELEREYENCHELFREEKVEEFETWEWRRAGFFKIQV